MDTQSGRTEADALEEQAIDVEEHAVISARDDAALVDVLEELFPQLFGVTLARLPDSSLAAETEVGTLFVGVLSDFVVALELRLPGTYRITPELLEYLNEENAGSAFLTFSALDDHLWVSANVDGRPLVPLHLARVVTYLFQAAPAVLDEVTPE
jgi:T3SS (YopN, CesT) and YbjN peptide-binding chaperone 1